MSTLSFTAIIHKKIWIVLLLSLFFSGLMVSVLLLLTSEQYETSTKLFLSAKSLENEAGKNYLDLSADRSLAENYAEIIKSELFAGMVIKKLGLSGITQAELSNSIRASVVKNSSILELKVRHKNKVTAKKIAEAFPMVINDLQIPISDSRTIIVLNMPADAKPLTSQKLIMVTVSLITGILLAIGFLLILKKKKRVIRTREDVESFLGLKVAGVIPDYDI